MGFFFHAPINLSNYGWVQYSRKECPLLTFHFPSPNLSKVPLHCYYAVCQLACLLSRDICFLQLLVWSNINMIQNYAYRILNSFSSPSLFFTHTNVQWHTKILTDHTQHKQIEN
jgi:hypothetical protein